MPTADGGAPVRSEMERVGQLTGASGGYVYRAQAPAAPARLPTYTARVIPRYAGVAVPLEAAQILWQR
jgi:starch phosphorylase